MLCSAVTHKGHSCKNGVASGRTIARNGAIYRLCNLHYQLGLSGLLAGLDQARSRKASGRWAQIDNVFINLDTYEEIEQLKFEL